VSKRGQDTEWDASHGMEEIHEFCFKEFAAVCLFWNFLFSGIPVILLIKAKCDMLIATVPFIKSVKRCAKRCPKVHSLSLLCGHTRIECQSVVRDTNPDVPVGMEETALFCSNES